MEDIDVRRVLKRLVKRWPLFLVCIILSLCAGYIYLNTIEKKYLVTASIQLKDQSMLEKESTKQQFISGISVPGSDPGLDDELGIISSYSTIAQTVERIGDYLDLHRYNNIFGKMGKVFAQKIYSEDIDIHLDSSSIQLAEVPVHISFIDDKTFLVSISAKNVGFYDYKQQKFIRGAESVGFERIGTVGQPFISPYANFTLKTLPNFSKAEASKNNYFFVAHSLKHLAESYQHRMVFAPLSEKSNIVTISLKGAIPDKEIQFLNTLNHVYINNDIQKKNKIGQQTISFIDQQLAGVSDTLHNVESKLEDFRSNSQVVDVSTTSQTLITQLNELIGNQTQLKTQNDYYRYLGEYLSKNEASTDVLAPSSAGIQDPTLASLITELSTLTSQKVSVSYNTNSSNNNNPVLKVLDQKILFVKKALADNIRNLIRSSDISIRENQRRIEEVRSSINRLPKDERNLTNIQRRFLFNNNIYNYFLEKKAEAGIAVAANLTDKRIIDPARQIGYTPVEPNRVFILLICCAFALLLPVGIIFAQDYFKEVVESEQQLKAITGLPVIGIIGLIKGKKYQFFGGSENEFTQDSFRYLRHQIHFLSQSQQVKVLGITSAASGEGKTFCAYHLAQSFATIGKRTLLIDFDFYNSQLTQSLNLENERGYLDYAASRDGQIIYQTPKPNLFLVPSGKAKIHEAGGIDSQDEKILDQFIRSCRDDFDIILIDTSPVGITPEYLTLNKYVDYTLLIAKDQVTEKNDLQRISQLIDQNRIKGGIIYNGVQGLKMNFNYYRRNAG
jgi:capsular exopolysaccharide synthesis family protein